MTVFVLEAAPDNLRGRLAIWMLAVRAGIYVGRLSQKVRCRIWAEVCDHLGDGNAVMLWRSDGVQGFDFVTYGKNRRKPTIVDGLQLVSFLPEERPKPIETGGEDSHGIPH